MKRVYGGGALECGVRPAVIEQNKEGQRARGRG